MMNNWNTKYPVFWINLERQPLRRHRMEWAISKGKWSSERWSAIDAFDNKQIFFSVPRLWQKGSTLPGIRKITELDPNRSTSRAELACLCSWQCLIEHLENCKTDSGWFLLMEDDVGSSLACPDAWPASLDILTSAAGEKALAIQLAPISSKARIELFARWELSNGEEVVVPKQTIRTHGNGAVLLHKNAISYLKRHVGRWLLQYKTSLHILGHPMDVRPVADKWLYACLPPSSCWVSTYPIFCLDAMESNLHSEHIRDFHQPSRQTTLEIWKSSGADILIHSFNEWNSQTS